LVSVCIIGGSFIAENQLFFVPDLASADKCGFGRFFVDTSPPAAYFEALPFLIWKSILTKTPKLEALVGTTAWMAFMMRPLKEKSNTLLCQTCSVSQDSCL
jgi:hypothetical protein